MGSPELTAWNAERSVRDVPDTMAAPTGARYGVVLLLFSACAALMPSFRLFDVMFERAYSRIEGLSKRCDSSSFMFSGVATYSPVEMNASAFSPLIEPTIVLTA